MQSKHTRHLEYGCVSNVNHVMSHELFERSMWELPVQKLKERYVQSTKLINNR